MKKCYCPNCGKELGRLQPPCKILQLCENCGKSLLVQIKGDEMNIKLRAKAKEGGAMK